MPPRARAPAGPEVHARDESLDGLLGIDNIVWTQIRYEWQWTFWPAADDVVPSMRREPQTLASKKNSADHDRSPVKLNSNSNSGLRGSCHGRPWPRPRPVFAIVHPPFRLTPSGIVLRVTQSPFLPPLLNPCPTSHAHCRINAPHDPHSAPHRPP